MFSELQIDYAVYIYVEIWKLLYIKIDVNANFENNWVMSRFKLMSEWMNERANLLFIFIYNK